MNVQTMKIHTSLYTQDICIRVYILVYPCAEHFLCLSMSPLSAYVHLSVHGTRSYISVSLYIFCSLNLFVYYFFAQTIQAYRSRSPQQASFCQPMGSFLGCCCSTDLVSKNRGKSSASGLSSASNDCCPLHQPNHFAQDGKKRELMCAAACRVCIFWSRLPLSQVKLP